MIAVLFVVALFVVIRRITIAHSTAVHMVIQHVRLRVLSHEVVHLLLLLLCLVVSKVQLVELSRQCIQIRHLRLDGILALDEQIPVGFRLLTPVLEVGLDSLQSLVSLP